MLDFALFCWHDIRRCDNLTLNDRNHTLRSFMNSEESLSSSKSAAPDRVSLSPFVNERLPNWEEILSARDVARLTRRPHWVIAGLILVRRFPRKRRYHGRGIGWLRSDVIHWLSKDLRTPPCTCTPERAFRARIIRQASFSFDGAEPFMRRGRRRVARGGGQRAMTSNDSPRSAFRVLSAIGGSSAKCRRGSPHGAARSETTALRIRRPQATRRKER